MQWTRGSIECNFTGLLLDPRPGEPSLSELLRENGLNDVFTTWVLLHPMTWILHVWVKGPQSSSSGWPTKADSKTSLSILLYTGGLDVISFFEGVFSQFGDMLTEAHSN